VTRRSEITYYLYYKVSWLIHEPKKCCKSGNCVYSTLLTQGKWFKLKRQTNSAKAKELESPAIRALGIRSRKLSNVLKGQSSDKLPIIYYLELLRATECTLSRWSRLHLQSLAHNNPHCARVVSGKLSPVFLNPYVIVCIIWGTGLAYGFMEVLCPSYGVINKLMMMNSSKAPARHVNTFLFFSEP
jgi:hypothetical protein